SIARFECLAPAVFCHLHGLTTFDWSLPHLPGSSANGAEVNPSGIVRPARTHVVGCAASESEWCASVGADNINFTVTFLGGIESDFLPIGRPPGTTDTSTAKRRQLNGIETITIANPDLQGAGPTRDKDNLSSVRRKLRGMIFFS